MEKGESLFGVVIAYVVPGFLGLWVIASANAVATSWLGIAAQRETTVGAFLFAALASLGVGLLLNGARWFILDERVFNLPGCRVPKRVELNQEKRKEHDQTYRDLRESHFRFYQFYGNTALALLLSLVAIVTSAVGGEIGWGMATVFLVSVLGAALLCYVAGEGCLTKYRSAQRALLGELPRKPDVPQPEAA